jgi:hypothetical protein
MVIILIFLGYLIVFYSVATALVVVCVQDKACLIQSLLAAAGPVICQATQENDGADRE